MKAEFYLISPRKIDMMFDQYSKADMVIAKSTFNGKTHSAFVDLPGVSVQILVERLRLLGDLTLETVGTNWTLNELYNTSYYVSGRTEG